MLSVNDAIERLLKFITPVETKVIPILDSLGYVLAKPFRSDQDLPLFTNSSMDGFAVRAEDISQASKSNRILLKIIDDLPAGKTSAAIVGPGEAVRIMTGASLPEGADAVVPVEFTNISFETGSMKIPGQIEVLQPVKPGDYIRLEGADVKKGSLVVGAGKRLRPQDLGFLAMLGVENVEVFRKPCIAILSTGDELIPVGSKLTPGKIFDANSFAIGGLVLQNHCELIQMGIAGDSVAGVKEKLDQAIQKNADLIISSAGVSVGAYDVVRGVIEEWGKLDTWQINMRPGKPLAFGNFREILFIGLPGNPVSAFVGFEVIVKPALNKLSGLDRLRRPAIKVRLTEPIRSDGRESYLRGKVWYENGVFYARLVSHQGSGNLHSLVQANALLIVPSEVKSLPIDAEINAWIIDEDTDLDY